MRIRSVIAMAIAAGCALAAQEQCEMYAVLAGASADMPPSQIRIIPDKSQTAQAGESAVCADLRVDARLVKVTEPELRKQVQNFKPGDGLLLKVTVQGVVPARTLELVNASYRKAASQPDGLQRTMAMIVVAALLIAFAALMSLGHPMLLLFVGMDKRYSNSQTQMALWFGTLIMVYCAAVYFRWANVGLLNGIGIPQNLLLLSGMSSLTFAGAKAITESKITNGAAKSVATAAPSLAADLTKDDQGRFDLGDFQMIVVSLVAVVAYLFIAHTALGDLDMRMQYTLPDVDTTILAAFGLGQGAYLTKKAAS